MPLQMQSPGVGQQTSTEGAIRGEIAKMLIRLEAHLVGDNWRSQHRWNTVGIHCRGITVRTACARRTAVLLLGLASIRLVEAPTYDNAVLANDVLRIAGARPQANGLYERVEADATTKKRREKSS